MVFLIQDINSENENILKNWSDDSFRDLKKNKYV